MACANNEVWLFVLAKLLHNIVLGRNDHSDLNIFFYVVNNEDKLLPLFLEHH
jgi:hypothetical protein